jgi:hypothetical protein
MKEITMPLIWLSGSCAVVMILLLVLGERTLPLFGGDRDLAARVYKTAFMALGTGVIVGLGHAAFGFVAKFLRHRIEAVKDQEGLNAAQRQLIIRHDLPGLLEAAAPWVALAIGLAGLVLAAVIWVSE